MRISELASHPKHYFNQILRNSEIHKRIVPCMYWHHSDHHLSNIPSLIYLDGWPEDIEYTPYLISYLHHQTTWFFPCKCMGAYIGYRDSDPGLVFQYLATTNWGGIPIKGGVWVYVDADNDVTSLGGSPSFVSSLGLFWFIKVFKCLFLCHFTKFLGE